MTLERISAFITYCIAVLLAWMGDLSLKDASTVSAIYAALHVQGVQRVELMKPLADMVLDKTQASFCTDFKAEIGGSDE